MSLNANSIAAFCANQYKQPLCPLNGALNIVYIEGLNPDGTLNADEPNRWNDLRLLIAFENEGWVIKHNAVATTEPGDYYTLRPTNAKGCARIAFGYHPPAWAFGHHKGTQPALVQRARVRIHRDLNRDGLRNRLEAAFWSEVTKDKKGRDVHIGINHHSTNQRFKGDFVGRFSAGCPVGKIYSEHIDGFLPSLKLDRRFLEVAATGGNYLFDTWVLPGDLFTRSLQK